MLWIGGSELDATVGSLADIFDVDESADVEKDVISVGGEISSKSV